MYYDVSKPMRVVIANHSNHSQIHAMTGRALWIVAPRENAPHDAPSYHIEIDNSFPRLDGKSYSRLTRVVYLAGERRIILADEEFCEDVKAVIDHEFFVPAGMTRQEAGELWQVSDDGGKSVGVRSLTEDEAADRLATQGRYSESEARIDGINARVFDALERAWESLNQFADFAITI